ncbi:MAG: hypothetical protein HDR20_11440 [Lachnospiraceae bacterium]|nr:hypothetical protein [Lachnospiraceae bacterium]
MEIQIIPLEKIVIDGKDICLGMPKADVINLLGDGELIHRHYYYNSELAIDYDEEGKVEFIEFLGGIDGKLQPAIYGKPAFETLADDIIDILTNKNGNEINDHENGCSYAFLNISVGIYRPTTPKDAAEDIEEMKCDGEYDAEYAEEEMRKASHWATIGIGVKDYYR